MRYVEITDRAESEVVRVTVRPAGLRKLVYDVEACTLYNIDQQRYFLSGDLDSFGRYLIDYGEDHRVRDLTLEDCEKTLRSKPHWSSSFRCEL